MEAGKSGGLSVRIEFKKSNVPQKENNGQTYDREER